MKLLVIKIQEPGYGCEERPDNYIAEDKVTLRGEEGEIIVIEVPDKELYKKNINEGDWVYIDVRDVIYKE